MLGLVLLLAIVRMLMQSLALTSHDASDEARGRVSTPPGSSSFALLVWIVLPLKCLLWARALLDGDLSTLPWLAGGLVVLFPWWIVSRVLVPLGRWRAAWALTHLAAWTWRGDRGGGALVAGVGALVQRQARGHKPDPKAVSWLVSRRDKLRPLRGGGILGSALLAELRDDREGMLELTESVLMLSPDARHAGSRGLAAQWLAAWAAERGDWDEVLAVTRRVRNVPAGARLLHLLARARVGKDERPVGKLAMISAWLLAPGRRRTWAWVRATWAAKRGAGSVSGSTSDADSDAETVSEAGSVESESESGSEYDSESESESVRVPRLAVTAHARLSHAAGRTITATALLQLALAWQEALDSHAVREGLAERAKAIGARRWDPVETARAQVIDELAELLHRSGISADALPEPPLVLAMAMTRVESLATAEVEARWTPIERRNDADGALPAIDEWREFVALARAYEAAVRIRGDVGRRLLFEDTDTAISNLAAVLWNDRSERSIANAMFAWLLPEAEAVHDPEAIRRLTRNMAHGVL